MTLYIDIGNSNIKLHFEKNGVLKYYAYKTNANNLSIDSFYENLSQEIKDINFDAIFICSVVASVENIVSNSLKKYFSNSKILHLESPIKTGIELKFPNSKEVGPDLIALAAYAASRSSNTIIINAGTATTIVHVKDKKFVGVIICPGLITSLNHLTESASLLGEINPRPTEKKMGLNSFEALSIGSISGHAHMLKGFVNEIDSNALVIVSGGASPLLKTKLSSYEFVTEATIEGMKVIENENK